MSFVSDKWKTLTKKILLENKYFVIWEEEVERPDGKVSTYYVNRREPFSVVIPYHDGKLYLARQYRYSVSSLSLEFPMGYVAGKNPLETAEIELKEEAGVRAEKMTEIGAFWVGVGKTDQRAYVYLAEDLTFEDQQLEDGEFISIESYTPAEVSELIAKGEIKDGISIVSYHYLEMYLKKHSL
jgi:ADP-ribose pyrophosphatase